MTPKGDGERCPDVYAEPLNARPWVKGCHSNRDGECVWEGCPQLRDGEPRKSGRHCPLDRHGTGRIPSPARKEELTEPWRCDRCNYINIPGGELCSHLREWLPSLKTGDPTPPPAGKDTERESLRGILHEFCAILLEQSQAGRSLTSNACEDAIRTLEARMARR